MMFRKILSEGCRLEKYPNREQTSFETTLNKEIFEDISQDTFLDMKELG